MLTTYPQAMTFNAAIKQIDTCRIYHSGPNYFVEIDIVMDGDMPLWRAHDIAQDLQDQVEKLPDVDRCFVHIDHETDHKPVSRSRLQPVISPVADWYNLMTAGTSSTHLNMDLFCALRDLDKEETTLDNRNYCNRLERYSLHLWFYQIRCQQRLHMPIDDNMLIAGEWKSILRALDVPGQAFWWYWSSMKRGLVR
jgi:hypothetical protein